jgi:hypothetical protein
MSKTVVASRIKPVASQLLDFKPSIRKMAADIGQIMNTSTHKFFLADETRSPNSKGLSEVSFFFHLYSSSCCEY